MGKHGKKQTCTNCHGSGKIQVSKDGKDGGVVTRSCPTCGGSGSK